MFFIPACPWWSMIIAVDVVALYGLCAYGSRENLPLNGLSAGRPYLWTRWAAVQPDGLPGQALRPASAWDVTNIRVPPAQAQWLRRIGDGTAHGNVK